MLTNTSTGAFNYGLSATIHFGLWSLAFAAAAGVLVVISRALQRTATAVVGETVFNYISFIGIMVHEMSHAVFAFLFLHEVGQVKIWQPHAPEGVQGFVTHRYRHFGAWNLLLMPVMKIGDFFIGIAPLIGGPLLSFGFFYFEVPGGKSFIRGPHHLATITVLSWQFGVWLYLTLTVLAHLELSPADLDHVRPGFAWLTACVFVAAITYFKIRHFHSA